MEAKDETKTKEWAEMSDEDEEIGANTEDKKDQAVEGEDAQNQVSKQKFKGKSKGDNIPPAQKGFKNERGDYVVTSINILDTRTDIRKERDEDDEEADDSESESEGYGEEDDTKETQKDEQQFENQPKEKKRRY